MSSLRRVPQPIPYQGSKRRIAGTILQCFPSHVPRIVEPFAGSAALSIAAATQQRANQFWINDLHRPLIALWREIIDGPEALANDYAMLWRQQDGREREYFNEIRHRFNQHHTPADFLYLLARCVKASVRYNANGEFNNTPDNRRKGARPKEMHWRVVTTSSLLRDRTTLTSYDYRQVLQMCSNDDLIYMDPPYQGVCGNRDSRYQPRFDHDEFCAALADLNERNLMFAVSYDGRTGERTHGVTLLEELNLTRLEICAGRSAQATLLGRSEKTYESLYLSRALVDSAQPSLAQLALL